MAVDRFAEKMVFGGATNIVGSVFDPPQAVRISKEDQTRHMEIILQSGDDAIEVLAGEWRDLHHRIENSPDRQSVERTRHAWRFFTESGDCELKIVVGRVDGRVVLIWPFVLDRPPGRAVGSWLGIEFDYRDVIAEPGIDRMARIKAAWQEAKAKLDADLIWCPAVRDSAVARDIFDQERAALVRCDPVLNLFIQGWPGWESFRQDLPRKFVREQDRRLRRMSQRGQISFRLIDEADAIDDALRWMFRHKSAWATRSAVYTRYTEPYRRYLAAICTDALASEKLLFGVLTLDNRIISAEIDIMEGSQLEMVFSAYDREWKSFGPGLLLFDQMLAWAFERNVTLVDFRIGAERYKRNYPVDQASLNSYLVPCTPRGRRIIAWRRMDLANRAKKAVRIISRFQGVLTGRGRPADRG